MLHLSVILAEGIYCVQHAKGLECVTTSEAWRKITWPFELLSRVISPDLAPQQVEDIIIMMSARDTMFLHIFIKSLHMCNIHSSTRHRTGHSSMGQLFPGRPALCTLPSFAFGK